MPVNDARHRYSGPIHRARRTPGRGRKLLLASAVAVTAVSSVVISASALATTAHRSSTHSASTKAAAHDSSSSRIFFGIVGDQGTVHADSVASVGHHEYGQVNGNVPVGRMITMGTSGMPWSEIAAAQSGSSTYANIVRWADSIKARGYTILFAFVHEPEASKASKFGTPSDYIAAYRHVVNIFRAQGVTNVDYVWQMTDWAFSAPASDPRAAARWYPGDSYVDAVGPDAYNWYNCGPGRWRDLSVPAGPALTFARAHGKKLVLPEFGSQDGPGRAQWLRNAQAWMIANRGTIEAAFYFDRPATTADNGCVFPLTSSADIGALDGIVDDTAHFTG